MKNLDQIRAKNALEAAEQPEKFAGANNGDIVKKVPPMIQQNGLLGTLAFAIDGNEGYAGIMKAVIKHLASKDLYPEIRNAFTSEVNLLNQFTKYLCTKDAAYLQALTAETLSYLNFLRRYAGKGKK